MKPCFLDRCKLFVVRFFIILFNALLAFFERLLFCPQRGAPKNILILKVGNIGDIVCAIPVFIAVRRTYPCARITLLTSPGKKGIPGAADLLQGAWYLDALKAYHSGDISTFRGLFRFLRVLRAERYDLFIHVPPHEWTRFRTMVRNMIFARLLGVRSAFGFRVRVIINLFRKAQVDYVAGKRETDSLLDMMRSKGIRAEAAEFDLPIPPSAEEKVERILRDTWGDYRNHPVVAIHSGTKANFPEKRWLPERFGAVARHLVNTHNARIVILGSKDDLPDASIISGYLCDQHCLITAGTLSLIESVALIKRCSFLLCIDGGLMHLAAAMGKPTVALFSIINILGNWFPYGGNHEIVFHRFLDCNYRRASCIRKSMELISASEVKTACDRVIARLTAHPQSKGRRV